MYTEQRYQVASIGLLYVVCSADKLHMVALCLEGMLL